jgi:hypothetical protein
MKLCPDKVTLKRKYIKRLGRKLNLKNPKTFNEKLQYIKLYYRNSLITMCADKYRVRDYVKEKINDDILVPLLWVSDKPKDIPFDELPTSFVIKTNHGSGMNILIKNKVNKNEVVEKLKKWLKINFYIFYREWAYKNIKKKIIIEKYLGENIKDYKIFVFNGKAKFIQVDTDRFIDHKRNFYNLNWEMQNIKYLYENTSKEIEPPYNLDRMIFYAEILANGFPFVRVDFHEVNKRLYFGELTFYPEAGFGKFLENHNVFDLKFGNLIKFNI